MSYASFSETHGADGLEKVAFFSRCFVEVTVHRVARPGVVRTYSSVDSVSSDRQASTPRAPSREVFEPRTYPFDRYIRLLLSSVALYRMYTLSLSSSLRGSLLDSYSSPLPVSSLALAARTTDGLPTPVSYSRSSLQVNIFKPSLPQCCNHVGDAVNRISSPYIN